MRIESTEGQAIYRQRAPTAEWINAMLRNRGLQQFPVRGLTKVNTVATYFALAHYVHRANQLSQGQPAVALIHCNRRQANVARSRIPNNRLLKLNIKTPQRTSLQLRTEKMNNSQDGTDGVVVVTFQLKKSFPE